MGALDFAGGTVVHISAGCAALAGALVLKRRRSHIDRVGCASGQYSLCVDRDWAVVVWLVWLQCRVGPNAAGQCAWRCLRSLPRITAAASAGLSWMFFDVLRGKKPSVVGFCVGAVVGLVAITPAAGFVAVPQSIFIGVLAAIISNMAVHFKATKTVLDDTLDVFPCHGIGGMVGMLMTGVFATKAVNAWLGANGLAYHNPSFFFIPQAKAMAIAVGYSFAVSRKWLIFKFVNFIVPLRVSRGRGGRGGLDASQHDEKSYAGARLLVATPEGLKVREREIM